MSHITVQRGPRVLTHLGLCFKTFHFHNLILRGYCSGMNFTVHKYIPKSKKLKTSAQTAGLLVSPSSRLCQNSNTTNLFCMYNTSTSICRLGNQAHMQSNLFETTKQALQVDLPSVCGLSTNPKTSNIDKKKEGSEQDGNFSAQDEKTQYKTWKALLTVPNLLTASRIVLTPYIGYLVVSGSYEYACGLFLFAGITDMLDGWIARRFPSQSSPAGSFMDPLADKFLVSTLFVTLTIANLIPVPLTCLVVARDISLIAAAFYVRVISLPPPITLSAIFDITNQTAELKPTLISKVNTAVQLGLIVTTLASPVFNYVDHVALQALWVITAGTTVWSGIGYAYAKNTFTVFKKRRQMRKQ